jgi:hypothetical protein
MGNPEVIWVMRNGERVGINAADFDEAKHEMIPEEGSSEKKQADEPDIEPPFNLSEVNAKDAADVIAETDDLAALEAFEREETEGKARKGVLAAIENRIKELEEE